MGFSWRALKSAFHILILHSPAGRQVITVVYWKITPSEAQVGEKTWYIYDTLNISFELKQTVALEITVLSWFNQDFNSNNMILWFNFMHMSLACPRGRPLGRPGVYVGEYKGIDWILCLWGGENSRHCFKFEGKRGRGNCKFCKIVGSNHGDITGIYRFPQTIIMVNIKLRKEEYEVLPVSAHVHDYRERPGEECLS